MTLFTEWTYKQAKTRGASEQRIHLSILGITCMHNDGAYPPEWIAHHLAAGFDPRLAHISFTPKGKRSVQSQALKLADDHPWLVEADWAMFFDCDEFFVFT